MFIHRYDCDVERLLFVDTIDNVNAGHLQFIFMPIDETQIESRNSHG